jgi:aerobic-type carbon monoxide dehydrogenase small subunit (CoxS/CutS family)
MLAFTLNGRRQESAVAGDTPLLWVLALRPQNWIVFG